MTESEHNRQLYYTDTPEAVAVAMPNQPRLIIPTGDRLPPYEHGKVWRRIITESKSASLLPSLLTAPVATEAELTTLRRLQDANDRWNAAVGPGGVAASEAMASAWAQKVQAGEPYDPLGWPTRSELEARHVERAAMAAERCNAISREAFPTVCAILQRLVSLAAKLKKKEEATEATARKDMEARGSDYRPSTWYSLLQQTPEAVDKWLSQHSHTEFRASPAAMLDNCIDF